MKIKQQHILDTKCTAFELMSWPGEEGYFEIAEWVKNNDLVGKVWFQSFYDSGHGGDVDYPAIQAAVDCPEEIKTLILLRWS